MNMTEKESDRFAVKSKKMMILAIGTGGSTVTVDLINKSRKLLKMADSIYFLDTDANPRLTIPDRIDSSIKSKLTLIFRRSDRVEVADDERVPVTFIEYGGGRGTGRDFIRSEICATEFLITGKFGESVLKDEQRIYEEDKSNIMKMWEDLYYHDIILLVHTLGGGTGGGSTPIIAREIKERKQKPVVGTSIQNATVISLCFLASKIENPLYIANSIRNLMEISKYVDIVLLFSNTKLWEYTEKTRYMFADELEGFQNIMNFHICRVLDILLSSEHDFNDFRNIITDPGVSNIMVPFISMKNERIPPLSLLDALKYPMASVCEGTLIKAVPLFIGDNPGMNPSFAHRSKHKYQEGFFDNTESYKQWIIGNLRPQIRDISLEELESIFDNDYNRLDTLILATCAADLSENLGKNNSNIDSAIDFWQIKIAEGARYWLPKLLNKDLNAENIKDELLQWYAEYLRKFERKIEEFNRK